MAFMVVYVQYQDTEYCSKMKALYPTAVLYSSWAIQKGSGKIHHLTLEYI